MWRQAAEVLLDAEAATRALVMINADAYTAWNLRKRLVLAGIIR